MPLYLVKYSRSDISNVTWEWSKIMDGSKQAAFLGMNSLSKYLLNTRSPWLKKEPKGSEKEPLENVCFSDNSYAGYPVICRSESGFVLYVLGVPVSWQSKAQRSVTLSSSEAEWVVLLEDVKKDMFIVKLLQSMKFLAIVRLESVSAINMAGNVTATKHMEKGTSMWMSMWMIVQWKFSEIGWKQQQCFHQKPNWGSA